MASPTRFKNIAVVKQAAGLECDTTLIFSLNMSTHTLKHEVGACISGRLQEYTEGSVCLYSVDVYSVQMNHKS